MGKLPVRVAAQRRELAARGAVVWETDCMYETVTLRDLATWCQLSSRLFDLNVAEDATAGWLVRPALLIDTHTRAHTRISHNKDAI